ncbi:hypothetical protein MXD59_00020 [Frankia sp. Ag45/Mut15]|uniref:Uncharacterized protein n=1 Tax=Frankia umida TaxID=573489 RepID=A0ABT0JRP7_9ACTN|nr:hypothetical protein [Frankia umida]MCK9874186.1 hypothetical protein [Frankia umida]
MSVDSTTIEDLPSLDVDPGEIESFLLVNGWQRVAHSLGVSAIWENTALDSSVMVPYDSEYRDFGMRVRDALRTISLVHGIERTALPLRILSARSDIVLLRADQLTPGDSIPLSEAKVLVDGISRMMLVAACSAIRPRPAHPGRRPGAATDFVANDLRLGHTIRGSFVLPVFVRHEGAVEDSSADPASGPVVFSRRVVETLASGLEATRELLDPQGSITLDDAVERGASAEMVEAVGAMGGQEGVRALELRFVLSGSIPAGSDTPSRIEVPRPQADQVEKIVGLLRRRPTEAQGRVVGQVVRLERAGNDDGGTAVIDGYLGRSRRRVRVNLSGDSYRLAIRAHEERAPVVATGEVSLVGRSWYLTGDTDVQVRTV